MASSQASSTNTSHVDEWETLAMQIGILGYSQTEHSQTEHSQTEHSQTDRGLKRRDYLTRRFNNAKLLPITADLPPEMLFLIATHICYEDDVDTVETLIRFMECIQSVIPPRVIIAELQRIRSPAYKVIHDFLMYMKFLDNLDQDIPECFGTVCCIEPDKKKWETTTYYESCHCGKRRCCCEYFDHISARCACGITELSINDSRSWFSNARIPTIIIPHLFTDINHLIEDIIPEPQIGMYVYSLLE